MIMSELKPCPFCGNTNIIIKESENEVDEKLWCISCQANIPRFKGKRKELIEAWNHRADGWIPVTERLPESSGKVLTYEPSYGYAVLFYTANHYQLAWRGVTHWMPLPEPPKGGIAIDTKRT